MENRSDVLMLRGVSATCVDCAGEAIFVPVEEGSPGEFCCTSCDAAVFLMAVQPGIIANADRDRRPRRRGSRVA